MKKDRFPLRTVLFLGITFALASCGGEPAGEHTSPEATQGDNLAHDDLDTTGTATDTSLIDTAETVQ